MTDLFLGTDIVEDKNDQGSFSSIFDFFSEPFHFPGEISNSSGTLAADSGDAEDDAFLAYLGFEESDQFSHTFAAKPVDTEAAALSILGGRTEEKRRREVWAKHLTEACESLDGIFDENQLVLFRYLFSRFYSISAARTEKSRSIKDGIYYFFSADGHSDAPVQFEELLSCLGQEIRPDYLRLRLIYKIWEGGWRMPALPFFRTPIPMFVQNRMESIFNRNKDTIFLEGWSLGDAAMMMELLWQNIGTPQSELTKLFLSIEDGLTTNQIEKMIDFLIQERIISVQTQRRDRLTDLKRKIVGRAEIAEKDIPRTPLEEPRLYLIGDNPQQLVADIWEHDNRIVNATFMSVFAFVS